jgi:hypothetical protein
MEMTALNAKFNNALTHGECDVVDSMLADGYIPPRSSLYFPCQDGNVDILTQLLGYSMDMKWSLFLAVKHNHVHLLDHLYLAGADVNGVTIVNVKGVNGKHTCLSYKT